jgi:protein-S-isoprenylcysteine O-methyltransferase Ste14
VDWLKTIAYWSYLLSWVAFGAGAIAGAIPKRSSTASQGAGVSFAAIVGTLLQASGIVLVARTFQSGPLHTSAFELAGAMLLAPLGSALYLWALYSSPKDETILVTSGPYAHIRHPMYLAFLAMLIATGLIASSGWMLTPAAALYALGSEIRIAGEESKLGRRFHVRSETYRRKTRWRYLPGIR